MVGTNCYVVYNENTKECFVVDPAAPSAPLVEFIRTEGLQLQGILLTHGHFDHIMGIDTLRREWSVPVYASALEQKVLTDANVNLSVAYGAGYVFADAKFLEDGASLALAGYQIRYASALEQKVLTDANVNLSVAYGAGYVFADAKFLEDGASLALAGYQIRMISTPGHTAGGCCYYIEEEKVLFSMCLRTPSFWKMGHLSHLQDIRSV